MTPKPWTSSPFRLALAAFTLGCLIFSNPNPAWIITIFLSAVTGGLIALEVALPRLMRWLAPSKIRLDVQNVQITVDEDGNVFAMIDGEPALLDLPPGYHPSDDNGQLLAEAILDAKEKQRS